MIRLFTVLFLLCFVLVRPAAALEPINVFVSVLPQKYLVERVGGERVSVSVMVRPGLSPETYEPTPKQMAALEKTRLYFRIAVPFESVWIERLQSINRSMQVVSCCGSIKMREPDIHDHGGNHEQRINDAHVWTSPKNAIVLAGLIRQALVETDPEHADYYSGNYSRLVSELEALHAEIKRELADLPHRYLIVSHPAWGYFAEEYDLMQIPIEQNGSEIRARELARLIQLARRENIKTVFVQKQFNPASARILAREINARIVELDPLAGNYIENLRRVTRAIKQGAAA
ncbi:MAG TPA: zinc ABC transporter substrate-binding protein [Gammaproteobacteria bacterium]|nr:zinc ABC transporter substrate-binding protein [Gammaproteobacteria bacterium]